MLNYRMGLLRRLQQDGHEVLILAPLDGAVEKLRQAGMAVHELSLSPRSVNPVLDLRLLHDLYRAYRRLQPDLVVHYTIKPNIYGSLAAHAAGITSLCITTGLGYTFVNENWISGVARWLYRLAFRYPREVWFLNEDDRQAFLARQLVPPDKALLLKGEGIDTEHFQPAPWPQHAPATHFLLIARLLWDKGVGEFVEAARQLRARYPHCRFQLLGPCDSANPSALQRDRLAAWEREGVIEYLGVADDVRPAIAAADCVVLPSYREGIPRTLLEAAAMARPLIVTDVPGCREVVQPGRTGLMCAPRSAAALAQCMEDFLALPDAARQQMGAAGRAFVCEHFSEASTISRYLQFLAACTTS